MGFSSKPVLSQNSNHDKRLFIRTPSSLLTPQKLFRWISGLPFPLKVGAHDFAHVFGFVGSGGMRSSVWKSFIMVGGQGKHGFWVETYFLIEPHLSKSTVGWYRPSLVANPRFGESSKVEVIWMKQTFTTFVTTTVGVAPMDCFHRPQIPKDQKLRLL